jgi:DNA repair exonuclease SbcCD nuclease subunit
MILAPDLHLRPTVPRCRTETEEEWFEVQRKTLAFLYSFREPVFFVGDIFNHWSPGWRLVELFLSFALKHRTYIMMGNHDARNNVLDPNSGYGIVDRIASEGHPFLKHIGEDYAWVHYGEGKVRGCVEDKTCLFLHRLVVQSNSDDFPGAETITARALLEEYPQYKYIITGDNHSHFIYEKNDRFVLNAGSMTKQSIKFKDEPRKCIRLTLGEADITKMGDAAPRKKILDCAQAVEMPDKGELVDDAYIVLEHEREDRYTQLVETLKRDGEISFDYKSNVFTRMEENELSEGATKYIREVLP